MKQILQSLKNGSTMVVDVPSPSVKANSVLIATTTTLVSAGTERMLVEFGKAGWLDKARQQPDKVKMVLDKVKTDGLAPTLEAVFNKLEQPLPLGYCNVGRVHALGQGSSGFSQGDRVISNGKHAEVVSVPVNLCAKVPDNISDEEAAFTVIAAIGLQGIRLVQPTLGECVVVTGLGLIGLVTVQLLRAHGCRVLGLDYDSERLSLAKSFGAEVVELSAGEDPVAAAQVFSRGRGVDAVIITASAKSNEPVHHAALMCRKRGRIVLVGVVGLELSRADFFEKELSFQVSCSYGPGRYDVNYEEKGQDYPVGFVRWTEQRNFEAVLDMMSDGRLDVKSLISHRFAIEDAEQAYELVGGVAPSLGIILTYPGINISQSTRTVSLISQPTNIGANFSDVASLSFIGSGNYATSVLIPAFKKAGARLRSVASSAGVSGVHAGRKYGFDETTTDTNRIFSDESTAAVVITTQHNSHANFVLQALHSKKHVFVEKPLCLTLLELNKIEETFNEVNEQIAVPRMLMVGFNRRFSPHIKKIKKLLESVTSPKAFVMTVNAGQIPSDHWTQDPHLGGGRIIGEACHFIDLLRHLAACSIVRWERTGLDCLTQDTVTLQFTFEDGSIGTIHYFSNGSKAFPKERLEIFTAGRVLQLDNFRKLTGFGWPGFKKMNLWRQDKGQRACANAFVEAVKGASSPPIDFSELVEVTRISIELSLRQ